MKLAKYSEEINFQLILLHTVPLISSIGNFLVTDIIFLRSHVKIILYFQVIYNIVNFIEVKSSGKPLYAFLTWESYDSPLICLAIMVISYFLFIGFCKTSELIKGRSLSTHLTPKDKNDKKNKR
jgi:hypothetical protein